MADVTARADDWADAPAGDAAAPADAASPADDAEERAPPADDEEERAPPADDAEERAPPPPSKSTGIEDYASTVKVLQADPSTPYHSASTFEEIGLSDELLRAVYALKFERPSKIQASSLPMILPADGVYKNLIAQGHNGSGKTACFVLAMLSRVDDSVARTQALCVVPTRELARQIADIVQSLGRFTRTTVRLAVSFTMAERQAERSSYGSGGRSAAIKEHIVVGTPGKITDLLKKRQLNASGMRIFVLDEADHMVSQQGMGDQTVRIKKQLPSDVQVLLFSATYADNVRRLALKVAPGANQITIERETLSLDRIQQYYIDTGATDDRFQVINDIYDSLQLGQTVVFVHTRRDAQALTTQLRNGGHTVSVLTGGEMTPAERDKVIDQFREGTTRVLVTTNVLSRGVDIPAITAVINYDLPYDIQREKADPEVYLHRIGRTGRFGRKGIAINLVYDDISRRMIHDLAKYYKKPIEKVEDVEALEEHIKAL